MNNYAKKKYLKNIQKQKKTLGKFFEKYLTPFICNIGRKHFENFLKI